MVCFGFEPGATGCYGVRPQLEYFGGGPVVLVETSGQSAITFFSETLDQILLTSN